MYFGNYCVLLVVLGILLVFFRNKIRLRQFNIIVQSGTYFLKNFHINNISRITYSYYVVHFLMLVILLKTYVFLNYT